MSLLEIASVLKEAAKMANAWESEDDYGPDGKLRKKKRALGAVVVVGLVMIIAILSAALFGKH